MEHTLPQDMPRHEDSRIYFGAGGYHDDNRTCEGVVEFQIEMETIFVRGFDLRLRKIWLLNVAV